MAGRIQSTCSSPEKWLALLKCPRRKMVENDIVSLRKIGIFTGAILVTQFADNIHVVLKLGLLVLVRKFLTG